MARKEMEQAEFHPIISSIQKIAMYETKARFYLVGSNNTQTRFRVLKVDRMEHLDLSVVDDRQEYSQEEIRDLVTMIDNGNRPRAGHRNTSSGVSRVVSAFGIVGFVRFLEGYYIILVTKRRKVGAIGHHTIYKIEDMSMVYIPCPGAVRNTHPDEARYVKMFQSIDLSSNFYFSYSYDITHTLQTNMTGPLASPSGASWEPGIYGTRTKPNERFVWNSHLLKRVESSIHPDWLLYVMHGFVGQSNVSVFGRSVYVTLVARRSNKYAGTRFLKRGSNCKGDVGNEVETEQIVHESGVSSLRQGRFSSFVQMRGSIPAQWSQDVSKMVPKPTISVDVSDPFGEVAGQHFHRLLRAYGSPIVILDLVKKREKKKHESTLSHELSQAVSHLNQFLPPRHRLQYVSLDMARVNKGKKANVMHRLAAIAHNVICQTGFYQSQKPFASRRHEAPNQLQTGIVRTNCVDCLDRTNTAQFAVGKCSLGLQLYALGLADAPELEFDSDCVRMLEELYEDHGDTLALQYGGSQLVHRIKTYRKTAPWTSQGNDIMQTLSRYYSNTFSDTEKQHTINLFLGLFVPDENEPPIWEHLSDYRLHNREAGRSRRPLTQWWDNATVRCLPRAIDQVTKACAQVVRLAALDETVDGYLDYHRPHELSVLSDMYAYKISHSVKDFMPHFTTDFSPFAVRVRPGRRRDETGTGAKYPSLTDRRWAVSTASSASSSSEPDDSDDEQTEVNTTLVQEFLPRQDVTYKCLFPTTKQIYGVEILTPRETDVHLYRRCIAIGRVATKMEKNTNSQRLAQLRPNMQSIVLRNDPTSEQVYTTHILRSLAGAALPATSALSQYQSYVSMLS